MNQDLFSYITKNQNIEETIESGIQNLHIYKNAYLNNMLLSLEKKFIATRIYLGEKNFKYFSYQYTKEFPSKTSNIDDFGHSFPIFLSETEELKEDSCFIKDIAKIDLLWFLSKEDQIISARLGSLGHWNDLLNYSKLKKEIVLNNEQVEIHLKLNKKNLYLMEKRL